jgi:hypothetical protein
MNQQLVDGARDLGQSKISTWNSAFQKAYNRGEEISKANRLQRKQERAAINNKVAGYIDNLNSDVDLTSLTGEQQQAVTNYLTDEKYKYADYANRIAKLDTDDPQYMELRDEMNGVSRSFQNLAGSLNKYKEDKKSYLENFDRGMLSDGNETSTLGIASNLYTDGGELIVEKGGNLSFYDQANETYSPYAKISKPFLKDFKAADGVIGLNKELYSAGHALNGARESMVRQRLNSMISKGGRQSLVSLAKDDFILEGGLGLEDSLFEIDREDELKTKVLDGYMSILSNTAAQGAADKRPSGRSRGGRSGGSNGAMQDEINTSGTIERNAREITSLKDPQEIVNALNSIDPTSKEPPYRSRAELYQEYLNGRKMEDSKESRQGFVDELGNSEIFIYDYDDPSVSRGVPVSMSTPQELYNLYIKSAGLSKKVTNYYIDSYKSNTQKQTKNTNSNGGNASKYN